MTARLHYWYLTHPRLGRPLLLLAVLNALAITATAVAPAASASTNAMVLNWTGLKDTYGVPLGNYYLSLPTIREQITQAGPDIGWTPDSWMAWTLHAMETMAFNVTSASILTAEAGAFIGIIALALWLMKITVSTYWLTVIGQIAHALTSAVVTVTTQLGLLVIAIPLGVFIGYLAIRRGEEGRGWTMILIALTIPAMSVAIFANPAGLMYGEGGLLEFARRVGFSVAQAATPGHNGAFDGAGSGGQVDALTASLITHTVREPLQLWNFGHVVDRVGGCGAAWSAAVNRGAPDGPIRAMQSCGNTAAVSYAQHLDGTNIWVGLVFVIAALLLGAFMVLSGWAVLKVSVKAIYTTVILLPTLWLGAIPGAPQRRAQDVVWKFFRHAIEVLVYIVFVSVMGLAVESIVAGRLPAQLGGANPFAHVLMMGAVSIAAMMLLRYIRADLSADRPGPGLFRQAGSVAVGMGMHAAVGGVGGAAVAGAKGLGSRLRHRGDTTPWEQLDAQAADARQVHGQPQSGFEPVPSESAGSGLSGPGQGGGADNAAQPSNGGIDPSGGAHAAPPGGGEPALSAPQPGGGIQGMLSGFDGARAAAPAPREHSAHAAAPEAPSVGLPADGPLGHGETSTSLPPMADLQDARHLAFLPLPPEPPHDEEMPPPPDDETGPPGGAPTNVSPITDT
ncbi:MAG: hypothetical protein K2X52_06290 [Mycobacteriaceae bacterium]|nr:hypothetical protein [Mycobacteriaceae bacterium]